MANRENVISDLESLRNDIQNKDDFIIMFKENALQMLDDVLALLKEQERLIEEAEEKGYERGQIEAAETIWKGR